MKFKLLNVFTKNGENGNQLAAVYPDRELSDEKMLQIAREFNFSETIFILNNFVRIFTPIGELSFAGHPTVGAAYLLKKSFTVPEGEVKVEISDTIYVTYPGRPVVNGNVVSAGPTFTITEVSSENELRSLKLPSTPIPGKRLYYFFKHDESHYSVRMFGMREDAATGSAACALAGYLRDVQGIQKGNIRISQGKDINRECEIRLVWDDTIKIGGEVKEWGEGTLKT